MKPKYDPEDMPHGICDDCGEECTATVQDFGIGPYEFWGARGVHEDWHAASPCCGAPVVPGGVKLVSKTAYVARRDHADGKVKKGDRYERRVYRHWREDGPGWFTVQKRVLA